MTLEKISDRIIFTSMFNDIDMERKDNEDSCALISSKNKEHASTFNDGHWAFFGTGEQSKWYQGYASDYGGKWDLRVSQMVDQSRIQDIRYPRVQARWAVGYSRRKIIETPSVSTWNLAILFCCTGLFMPRTSSVSTGSLKGKPKQTRKCSQDAPRNSNKTRRSQVIGGLPRQQHASGNRMLQNLKNSNSMPFICKIEYLRTTAKFYHPIEKGTYYVTTTLEDDGWGMRIPMRKEYTAPRNRKDSRPYASIDVDKELVQS